MKRILFFILPIPFIAKSQDDSTKYINYRFEYGKRSARLQADSVFNTPLRDTTFHPSRAGSLTTRPQDGKTYQWNGTKWNEYGVGGSGSGTVNNGTQYRIAIYPNNGAAVGENTAITGNRVIVSNSNGLPTASSYTSADLDSLFVSDTISNIGTTGDTILKQVTAHKMGLKPFLSSDFDSPGDSTIAIDAALKAAWNAKQAALVSGTNIKTVNGNSLLGIGNVTISDTANLRVNTLGSTGTDVVVPRNDTLYHRLITEGPFIKIDTLTTHELRVSIDTASTDFHNYIALYGNDGGGTSTPVIDSIQYAANDTVATGNVYINTNTNRLRFKGVDGRWRGVAITDSSGVFLDVDADATAYINAVISANGSDPFTDDQKTAINNFVKNQKTHGVWSKAIAIYLPIYTNSSASAINLKSPGTYNLTWGGGTHTFATSGVTPGSSSFANTGITASSSAITQNSVYLAVYTQTSTLVNTYETLIGCSNGANYLQFMWNGADVFANANTGQVDEGALASYAGYNALNRTGSTTAMIYQNGANVKSISTTSTGIPSSVPIYIEATRNEFGSFNYPATRKWSAAKISTGLTPTEAADDNTDIEALMDAFSIGQQ